jgi:ATP adenylyltransferase
MSQRAGGAGPTSDACFLCGGTTDVPSLGALEIASGARMRVIASADPFNSGEIVIAPIRHVESLEALDDDDLVEITGWLVRVETVMSRRYAPQGINIGFRAHGPAGDGEHLAIRVVPRWVGDMNFMPVIAGTKVLPQSIEETVRIYRDGFAEA